MIVSIAVLLQLLSDIFLLVKELFWRHLWYAHAKNKLPVLIPNHRNLPIAIGEYWLQLEYQILHRPNSSIVAVRPGSGFLGGLFSMFFSCSWCSQRTMMNLYETGLWTNEAPDIVIFCLNHTRLSELFWPSTLLISHRLLVIFLVFFLHIYNGFEILSKF